MLRKADAYINQHPNSYIAAIQLAARAREKRLSLCNKILDSEAIRWELTNEPPTVSRPKNTRYYHVFHQVIADVDDPLVARSVRRSYGASLSEQHLIYRYHKELTSSQRSRVRILTRMIWYNIQREDI